MTRAQRSKRTRYRRYHRVIVKTDTIGSADLDVQHPGPVDILRPSLDECSHARPTPPDPGVATYRRTRVRTFLCSGKGNPSRARGSRESLCPKVLMTRPYFINGLLLRADLDLHQPIQSFSPVPIDRDRALSAKSFPLGFPSASTSSVPVRKGNDM